MDSPAMIVVDGETDSQSIKAGIQQLEAAIASDQAFIPSGLQEYPEANLTVLYVRLAGDPFGKEATN
ncbi:MAG: hypothetical protein QGI09_10510, partial [Dehalococcoidia bacterium]|nr:hypothetical protein [Dehalococcoidia bacterium]